MVTRLAIYGGIGTPYGNFAGKVAAPVVAVEETFSGGYFPHVRRKTDEEKRIERIQLGILPPDPLPEPPTPKRVIPDREALTPREIETIRARVQNEVDLEIALHLHEIEKKRRQLINLILILDAA